MPKIKPGVRFLDHHVRWHTFIIQDKEIINHKKVINRVWVSFTVKIVVLVDADS